MSQREETKSAGRFYLVNKAFRKSLAAAMLTSAVNSLCSMADAMITGKLIGPDALATVGLTIPILTALYCFSDLMIDGAVARASVDFGNQDLQGMYARLSVGVSAGLALIAPVSILLFFFLEPLSSVLAPDSQAVQQGFVDYMRVAVPSAILISALSPFPKIIRVIGNPGTAARILAVVSVGNIVCDLLFIRLCGMGIDGSAWGTLGGWILGLGCILFIRKKLPPFRWTNPLPHIRKYLGDNMAAGLPGVLGSGLISVLGFTANSCVVRVAGSNGLEVLSVGMQIVNVAGAVAFGMRKALQTVGGLLEGEKDAAGLRHVFRIVLGWTLASVSAAALLTLAIPGPILSLFGCNDPEVIRFGTGALRVFVLFLPFFFYTLTHSVIYQIRKYYPLAMACSALTVALVIALCECFSAFSPGLFWWAFPLGGALGVAVHLLLAAVPARRGRVLFPSLIPREDESLSLTLVSLYTRRDAREMCAMAEALLEEGNVCETVRKRAALCMEEITQNIVAHAKYQNLGFFSMRIRIPGPVCVTVRDDGIPFNPMLKEGEKIPASPEEAAGKPGLRIINTFCDEMTYSYVCGQNMLQMKWFSGENDS